MTIGANILRTRERDFNEPAVDPSTSRGHKDTRGTRTNYGRGYKPRPCARTRARAVETSVELLVTAYVTNLTSLCASAYNARARARARSRVGHVDGEVERNGGVGPQ